jgi:uncharacterized protein (DUF2062 family)
MNALFAAAWPFVGLFLLVMLIVGLARAGDLVARSALTRAFRPMT